MQDLVIEAAKFARKAHEGQTYGEYSYFAGHLIVVADLVTTFTYEVGIATTKLRDKLIASAFLICFIYSYIFHCEIL